MQRSLSSPSRVTQKLAYARWHLGWSEALIVDPEGAVGGDAEQQCEALLQSCLFHLVSAYRALLAEIAADLHLPPDQVPDTRSALRLSAAYTQYLPPVLGECVNLERRQPDYEGELHHGWLAPTPVR